jgi:hypothetical protein
MGLILLYSELAGECEALTKSRIVGVRSVTNTKLLIVFVEVVEFDALKALLLEPFVEMMMVMVLLLLLLKIPW